MTARQSLSSGRGAPFPHIDFLFSLRPTEMKLGLEQITGLLASFGDPQEAYPSVLVAGTNGKGSVTTFVSSIARSAGLRTGTFYSPHLFRVNERIRVNGDEIPSPVLDGILGELRERFAETPFTFFEGVTAAAAIHFQREKVDIGVFEVGLGGRLDATRLVRAAVTVITGISRDHREHLGKTRADILMEKLGITRKGVPLAANLPDRSLSERARAYCGENGIPLVDVREGARTRLRSMEPGRMAFDLSTPERDYGTISMRMIGRPQIANALTAARTAEILAGRFPAIGPDEIAGGLGRGFFHGRFQVVQGRPRIVLDVSHNEEALLAAMDTLTRISPPERNVIVFGVMARKELGRFPEKALGACRKIILVPLKESKSATAEDLAARFGRARLRAGGGAGVAAASGMRDAVEKARGGMDEGDTLLILGSHYTVEEAAAFI